MPGLGGTTCCDIAVDKRSYFFHLKLLVLGGETALQSLDPVLVSYDKVSRSCFVCISKIEWIIDHMNGNLSQSAYLHFISQNCFLSHKCWCELYCFFISFEIGLGYLHHIA